VPAPAAVVPTVVAIDLHNTLDTGAHYGLAKDTVPAAFIVHLRRLQRAGYSLWIVSYIGQRSTDQREKARRTVRDINIRLIAAGSTSTIPLKITDRRTGIGGKTEFLRSIGASVIIDDNALICQEAQQAGLRSLQVTRGWTFANAAEDLLSRIG
jgi:hypothetical protein